MRFDAMVELESTSLDCFPRPGRPTQDRTLFDMYEVLMHLLFSRTRFSNATSACLFLTTLWADNCQVMMTPVMPGQVSPYFRG